MAGAATLLSAPQASALSASPTAVCGPGYSVVDSHQLPNRTVRVYLLHNASNGYDCVTTVRGNGGDPVHMSARLEVQGGSAKEDTGEFTSYAGPVRLHAAGKCVKWSGWFGDFDQSYWGSGWSHCG